MAGLSSPGIGSGLDINGLVSKLMAVEQQPLTTLTTKETGFQAKLSAYGSLKGALSTLQTAMNGLSSPAQYNASKAAAADSTILTASTVSTAKTGTYGVEVQSLAQPYKISAPAVSDPTTALGSGTLTIDFGTYAYDTATPPNITGFTTNSAKTAKSITIDSTNNSINGIRDAVNAAGAGVTASIINVGSGYRLVLSSSDGGTENGIRIKVADADGNNSDNSGLSKLAYDPAGSSGTNMTENQQAKSAIVNIDGLTITKSSNTISDAIQGVTLNLLKTNVGSPTTFTVSSDTSGVSTAVQSFVKSYNDLASLMKNLDSYDATNKKAGVLLGDSALLGIESQLRNVLYKQVTNNGAVSSLSDIGVSFQRDGTLAVNSTKLNTALTNSAQNVGALFATMGVASDSLVTYAGSTSATLPGNYGLQLTEVATHAAVEGSVTPTSTITSGSNDTLALWIDGSVVNVTLAAGNSYTPATLATEIQQEVNKVLAGTGKSVSVTNDTTGKLRITSSAWGSTSQVQLQGGTAYSSVFGAPDAHGRVIGSQAANTTITSGLNDALSLNVDGTSVSVKLDAGSYSAAGLAGVLQASINSALGSGPQVTVTQSSGVLTIASASTGSGSFVAINDGSGWAGLLGSPDTIAAQGRDVAGTLGGAFASSSGQTLTGTSDASGLAVLVAGGVPGPRGTITFNRGVTATLTSTIDSLLSSTGTIAGRTDGINSLIKDIGNQRTQLNARLVDIEARYRKQFNSLDSLIASMQQTSTYLTQQFASLSSTNTTK